MRRMFWILFLFLGACGSVPIPPLQSPLMPEPADSAVLHRILAYGDTRTGVLLFESQANFGEEVHDWVASQMVKRLQGQKAEVFFTGDAVYAGGATFHYDNFVTATSKFKAAGLPFYPCAGNHELTAGVLGVLSPWFDGVDTMDQASLIAQAPTAENAQLRQFIVDRHQELKKVGHHQDKLAQSTIARLNARSADLEKNVLPRLETQAAARSAQERVLAASRVMEALYVKRAGMTSLEPVFGLLKRSYYAMELSSPKEASAKPSILALMLDTNSLDARDQQRWFAECLSESHHDLVLVFGHHPPGTIEGWGDPYKTAFLGHKKATIWVVSHVHSFAYAFPTTPTIPGWTVPSRALFVSGGGGAPLDDTDERVVPIPGWTYGPKPDEAGKMFHFLDIKVTKDSVFISVVGCSKKGEPMTVRATYRVKLGGS